MSSQKMETEEDGTTGGRNAAKKEASHEEDDAERYATDKSAVPPITFSLREGVSRKRMLRVLLPFLLFHVLLPLSDLVTDTLSAVDLLRRRDEVLGWAALSLHLAPVVGFLSVLAVRCATRQLAAGAGAGAKLAWEGAQHLPYVQPVV